MRTYAAVLLLAMGLMATGCSTIMNGTHRDVAITSDPGNVRVTIDGESKGTTPLVASLWRGGAHVIKFERDGYEPIEQSITRDFYDEWVGWNAIFGPFVFVGLLVDSGTGAMYDLSHKRVIASFPSDPSMKNPSLTALQNIQGSSPGNK
jgi:hypothetical protein